MLHATRCKYRTQTGSGRGRPAGDRPPTGGVLNITAAVWNAASTGGVLATKSEQKMLASTCLYSLYAWLFYCSGCSRLLKTVADFIHTLRSSIVSSHGQCKLGTIHCFDAFKSSDTMTLKPLSTLAVCNFSAPNQRNYFDIQNSHVAPLNRVLCLST